MTGPHVVEEAGHLHRAAPRVRGVDEIEGVARTRNLRVDNGIARGSLERLTEMARFPHRDDGVLIAVDEEERRRVFVDTRHRRCRGEDVRMARLATPHHDPFEETLKI